MQLECSVCNKTAGFWGMWKHTAQTGHMPKDTEPSKKENVNA